MYMYNTIFSIHLSSDVSDKCNFFSGLIKWCTIAALAGASYIFQTSNIFGFLAIILAAVNIFWRFSRYSKNVANVQKEEEINMSANLSALFYLISGILFILALRGLSSPETEACTHWYCWYGNINNYNFFVSR